MSMRKTTLAPGQLLRSVHMEKSYLAKVGYPPLEVGPEQRKTHVNSYRRQTVHRGKVDPGVCELPRDNELSRDHVNRPWTLLFPIQSEEAIGRVSLILIMLTSSSNSSFERCNISLKENIPDDVDPNSNGHDYCR